jgi:cysteine desulfurase
MHADRSIYLDYAATTPVDPRVEAAMAPFARRVFGNPSSLHAAGRAARAAIDDARDTLAAWLGCDAAEIVFTSGGTEADNLAVKGVARAGRGRHIVTTAIEHHAVLESALTLEREGFRVTQVAPTSAGFITPEAVEAALEPDTALVSVIYASNEIGTIQPIADIAAVCRARGVPFHTDAVQAVPELPLNVRDLGIDLLALSAHKLYGPKAVGALYVRAGTRLAPLLTGGEQEHARRAGTENVAGIVGLGEAARRRPDGDEIARVRALRDRLLDGLLALPGTRLNGARAPRLANNLNVSFAGLHAETLLLTLDLEGIAVSTGAACAAGAVEPSHVLQALGCTRIEAAEALRFSLGRDTTQAEIDDTIAVVTRVVERMRR